MHIDRARVLRLCVRCMHVMCGCICLVLGGGRFVGCVGGGFGLGVGVDVDVESFVRESRLEERGIRGAHSEFPFMASWLYTPTSPIHVSHEQTLFFASDRIQHHPHSPPWSQPNPKDQTQIYAFPELPNISIHSSTASCMTLVPTSIVSLTPNPASRCTAVYLLFKTPLIFTFVTPPSIHFP